MTTKKPKPARKFSPEFKVQLIEQVERGELTASQAIEKASLHESVFYNWMKKYKEGKLRGAPKAGKLGGNLTASGRTKSQGKGDTLSDEAKAAAVAEWKAGGNANEIAQRLGVSGAAIYYWNSHGIGGKASGKANGKPSANQAASGSHRIPHVAQQNAVRDATVFLRKAKAELMAGIRSGGISEPDSAHLLALLALRALQGEA